MERAIEHLPCIELTSEQSQQMRQGQIITTDAGLFLEGVIRLYENNTQFIGLGEWQSPTELKAKRLLSHCSLVGL
jgi:tRNA pseudouridine55 synthase